MLGTVVAPLPSWTIALGSSAPSLTMPRRRLYLKLLPTTITPFASYKALDQKTKGKIKNLIGVFSSAGPISETRLERESERGTGKAKNFVSEHPIVRTVNNKKALYLSPGHTIAIKDLGEQDSKNLLKFLFNHQTKKEFQMSFFWEKNSIAIWDNHSILHSATPFVGRRMMHRIILDA